MAWSSARRSMTTSSAITRSVALVASSAARACMLGFRVRGQGSGGSGSRACAQWPWWRPAQRAPACTHHPHARFWNVGGQQPACPPRARHAHAREPQPTPPRALAPAPACSQCVHAAQGELAASAAHLLCSAVGIGARPARSRGSLLRRAQLRLQPLRLAVQRTHLRVGRVG